MQRALRRAAQCRRLVRASAPLLLALAGIVWLAPPLAAQQNSGTVSGTTVTVTLSSPTGQPVLVFAVQLSSDQAGNVTGITCPSSATPNATGGPGNSPECIFRTGVTSATMMLS